MGGGVLGKSHPKRYVDPAGIFVGREERRLKACYHVFCSEDLKGPFKIQNQNGKNKTRSHKHVSQRSKNLTDNLIRHNIGQGIVYIG